MVVKTKQMNIRVPETDYRKIKQFADFNGKSISSLMLDAVREIIEYQEDLSDIEEYEKEKELGTLKTHSWADVKKGAGLCYME